MTYRYEVTNVNGRTCCRSNSPANLCPACRAKVSALSVNASDHPDPPPSLIERIRSGTPPTIAPRPTTPNIHGVDDPPDLCKRIQDEARRKK